MRKTIYKFSVFFILLLCIFFFSKNFELIQYGIMQGKGQLNLLMHTEPVEDILQDPLFPDSLKKKLILISEIKKFAIDSLGMHPTKNYTTIYNQHSKPLMWVVTASKPFAIQPYEWTFPFLGKLSYKGFFIKEKAESEAEKLRKLGYDIDIGTASGWSTLGLFKDPILSEMLRKKEGSLANLIIHELTHGSVFISDSVNYNENLANFIGHQGAIRFLSHKYGSQSLIYLKYMEYHKDAAVFSKYTLTYAKKLDSMYQGFIKKTNLETKFNAKYKLLYAYIKGIDTLSIHHKTIYKNIAQNALRSKNAYFISFLQYDSKVDNFQKEFELKFHSDLKRYVIYLKQKFPENHFGL